MEEEKIENLAQFSKEHPGTDVTSLLQEELKPGPNRWRIYIISALFPPVGLYYTAKYLFFDNDTDEKRRLAWVALILTVAVIVISLGAFWLAGKALVKSHPEIQQNPTDLLKDYRSLLQP